MASFKLTLALLAVAAVWLNSAEASASRNLLQLPTAVPSKVFNDSDYFQLALNLEYLEAEFYLWSAYGHGVEKVPTSEGKNLTGGGPNSVGGQRAALSNHILSVAQQLALQEVGHIRIIREYLGNHAISRPLINIGSVWPALFRAAYNYTTKADFSPYVNDVNWLLAAYALPYVGLTAYVGTNPNLVAQSSKKLLAGVLGVEGSQDAMLRTLLYTIEGLKYNNHTVADITDHISQLRNALDGSGKLDDEGLTVPLKYGAEGRLADNIIAANADSLSYARNPPQTLAIVYSTGHPNKPGGFWPKGANGVIGTYYLKHKY